MNKNQMSMHLPNIFLTLNIVYLNFNIDNYFK